MRQGINKRLRTKDINLGTSHINNVVEATNELTKHLRKRKPRWLRTECRKFWNTRGKVIKRQNRRRASVRPSTLSGHEPFLLDSFTQHFNMPKTYIKNQLNIKYITDNVTSDRWVWFYAHAESLTQVMPKEDEFQLPSFLSWQLSDFF